MGKEDANSPRSDRLRIDVAKQQFDIPRWVDSQLAEINDAIALGELGDNALDETLSDAPCIINIQIDKQAGTLVFKQQNTTGMNAAKMKEFVLWGGVHQDPEKIKEHRLGGKLALLYLLSKSHGNLAILSRPPGSPVAYRMEIDNWWKRLTPKDVFPIKTIPEGGGAQEAYTRFELSGLRNEPLGKVWEAVDTLGMTYGELIRARKMQISVREYSQHGKKFEKKDVLPVTIPFRESLFQERTNVPAGDNKSSPRIGLTWGILDTDLKKRDETVRRNHYGIKRVAQIWGDRVYYYYHGRMLQIEPLSSLKLPGYTPRMTFESFALKVDIQSGWTPKTILKTALRATAPETIAIRKKIIHYVAPDIAKIVSESRGEEVSRQYKEKIRIASEGFSTVLSKVFDNNIKDIADMFRLPTEGVMFEGAQTEYDTGSGGSKRGAHLLPGSRAPIERVSPALTKGGERKGKWINPIPELHIASFPDISPEAHLVIDASGKPVIEINYLHPAVFNTLEQRGKTFMTETLRIAAVALFHEKWIKEAPKDSSVYAVGMQKDVANFLKTAKELKII